MSPTWLTRVRYTHVAASSNAPATTRKPGWLRVSLRRTLNPGALSTAFCLSSGVDSIPGAGHGGDDRGFAEAFAQSRDRDAHRVGERVCVLIPRPSQQLFGAAHAAAGRDQDFKHCELLAGERDVAAVAVDLAAERIHPQPGDLTHRRSVVCSP